MSIIAQAEPGPLTRIEVISKATALGERPCTVGIYFLLLDDLIVYIGKSLNCEARIHSHIGEKTKQFNRYAIQHLSAEKLEKAEAAYVFCWKPSYNRRVNAGLLGYISMKSPRRKEIAHGQTVRAFVKSGQLRVHQFADFQYVKEVDLIALMVQK